MRFLDNFSAGTRGAASAEQFLRTGRYAVIFLHRQHSLQPFSRHYSHSTNPFLDLLDLPTAEASALAASTSSPRSQAQHLPSDHDQFKLNGTQDTGDQPLFPNLHALAIHRSHEAARVALERTRSASSDHKKSSYHTEDYVSQAISVRASEQEAMHTILSSYKLVQSLNLQLSIPFVTVFDYLFLLRGIAQVMNGSDSTGTGVGRRAIYYLAAAVSDFFLPQQKMVSKSRPSRRLVFVVTVDVLQS